jgi:hypothetical protein
MGNKTMTDTTYNGWTNYATWRVNLEMIDGLDPHEMGWGRMDRHELEDALKYYVEEAMESQVSGKDGGMSLIFSYAMAFLSDVEWREIAKHMIDAYELDHDEDARADV